MGTDIHPIVEVRKSGVWTWHKGPFLCYWCLGSGAGFRWEGEHPSQKRVDVPGGCYWCKGAGNVSGPWRQRNYDVFGILANVRNGRGFAGCDLGDGWKPIAAGRGIPADLSEEARASAAQADHDEEYSKGIAYAEFGDHSESWVGLDELLAYEWQQGTEMRGVMALDAYRAWDKTTPPSDYSGDVSGGGVTKLSRAEADHLIAGGDAPPAEYTYVRVSWRETAAQAAGDFHAKFIPELVAIAEQEGVAPRDVRLVFGFDS